MVLDLDAFAALRCLVNEEEAAAQAPGHGDMIVNIGSGVTNIVVHSQGSPRFVASCSWVATASPKD